MITLRATLRPNDLQGNLRYEKIIIDGQEYEGVYSFYPSLSSDIILQTKQKKLRDDITCYKVPYAEVSNPQGGETITIG